MPQDRAIFRPLLLVAAALLACCAATVACSADEIPLKIVRPANAPYLVAVPERNVFTDDFTTVVLNIRSTRKTVARLFWVQAGEAQINESKSIMFSVDKADHYQEYVFDIASQNRGWTGFVSQMVFFPDGGLEGVDLDYSKVQTRDIFSLLRSGWREFWSPESRVVTGSTVNVMRTTRMWGAPVNYYAYWIVLLCFAGSFGYFYFRSKDPMDAFRAGGRITVVAMLVCWGVLQLSFTYNEYTQVRDDVARYDLKSLEEKQAISIGPDLFDFFRFCAKELPERAGVKIVSSGPNESFVFTKGWFYLYPMDTFAKDPEYLICYGKDEKEALKENPGFRPFKSFHEGAYILWKKK